MKYLNLLNVQSCYNFLKSNIKINDYINFLKNNNFNYGFYAEQNTMYGVAEFYKNAIKNNLTPIVGLNIDLNFGFALLYAKNNNGYKIISTLSSIINGKEKLDLIEKEKLFWKYISNDLIVVVAFNNNEEEKIEKLYSLLNKENFYFGITKKNYNLFSKNKNIVFANEINFFEEKDFLVYRTLRAIDNATVISTEVNLENNFYFKLSDVEKLIDINVHNKNIEYIATQINYKNIFDFNKHFLKFSETNNLSSKDFLKLKCEKALENYLLINNDLDREVYKQRLNYELEVINKMNFNDYFLIVNDLIDEAKRLKILYGPGRGSAASSLVAFLLEITKINPIQWNLFFERFLNIDRTTLPDIDLDFQDDRREEILNYLLKKYGHDHFATITTFQTIGIKNAIRDCLKAFEIPMSEVEDVLKKISDTNLKDIDKELEVNFSLQSFSNKFPNAFEIIKKIINLPRQPGTHAAGVVFCDLPIYEVVPTKINTNGFTQTQFSMDYLEEIGLIKTDILSLKNLTIIQEIINTIYSNKSKKEIFLNEISLTDKDTFTLLQNGKTEGIFQLESPGMTNTLMQMNVESIEEIALTSALYRPGPQENIATLIKRKKGKEKFSLDEDLKNILNNTYGIIVYQEQIMQILQKVSNMSLNKADNIRRAISKKNLELMKKYKEEFIEDALKNNYSREKAIAFWNDIEKFASYGFNKSHAIAYSIISYWMAYLKANYTVEFYCALLNSFIGDKKKINQYLLEMKNEKIKIKTPSILNYAEKYICNENIIYTPLIEIKFIGMDFLNKIKYLHENKKEVFNDLFSLIWELKNSDIDEQKYDALVYSGALDNFGYSRKLLINEKQRIFNFSLALKNNVLPNLTCVLDKEKTSFEELVEYEKEYLGFYVSADPLTIIRNSLRNEYILSTISSLTEDKLTKLILVNVEKIRTQIDVNQNEMAFLTVSDETGTMFLTVFSSLYKDINKQIKVGKNYIFQVQTQLFNNRISSVLMKIHKEI